MSNREVAARTDYDENWVGQICNQPWFRLRLVKELKDAGRDAVSEVIKSAALDSVFTLIGLRDNDQTPASVRAASANALLDRFLGKPTQKLEHEDKTKLPSNEEIRNVESELQQSKKS